MPSGHVFVFLIQLLSIATSPTVIVDGVTLSINTTVTALMHTLLQKVFCSHSGRILIGPIVVRDEGGGFADAGSRVTGDS